MIIVLTMGRSGSSLLMQSLGTLGVKVIGRAFDEGRGEAHYRGNPGGYWEEPQILYGGPRTAAFQSLPQGVACKMELCHLSDPEQWPHWSGSADRIRTIYLSIRDPSEQARSEHAEDLDVDLRRFQLMTQFLRRYVKTFQAVIDALENELPELNSKVYLVDYASSGDPDAYVRRLIATAGLEPTSAQTAAAISNIDASLHRIRYCDLSVEERRWAEKTGARAVYESLAALVQDRISKLEPPSLE